MSKKENKANDWLWNLIKVQKLRLKDLISKFYPDMERVELGEAPQVGKVIMDSPMCRRFSEDEQALLKCLKITEDARKKGSPSIEIDFFCTSLTFQDFFCVDYDACIIFKTAPEDIPIYVKEGFDEESIVLKFLIDGEEKEAFLVLEDFDTRDKDNDFMGSNSSFIRLPEFHAIISGYEFNDTCDYNAGNLCFMVSFSQAEGRCIVEKIYDHNICLLDQLFPLIEPSKDNGEPASDSNSQPEAVPSIPTPSTNEDDEKEIGDKNKE